MVAFRHQQIDKKSLIHASWEHLRASCGFYARFGRVLARLWGVLGASWARLGASWRGLEASKRDLGASWRILGASWRDLGTILGCLGRVLPRLGAVFGRLGAVLSALKRVPFKIPSFDRFSIEFLSQLRPMKIEKSMLFISFKILFTNSAS